MEGAHRVSTAVTEAMQGVCAGNAKLASRKLVLHVPGEITVTRSAFSEGGALPRSARADGERVPPPVARRGVGVSVPPNPAESWISRRPPLLRVLDALDRVASRPLALLGEHALYRLVRADAPAPRPAP